MRESAKVSANWHWIVLVGVLLVEFLLLSQLISRHHAWIYPRWNDQIQYLTEAYTGFEYLKEHGFLSGLWETLVNPSAQGTLHDFFAVLVFKVVGPSRAAALSVNLLYFLVWQAALFLAVIRATRSRSLAFASVGLLLAVNSAWWGGPGSIVDFRLDWMATCAMGVSSALALCTDRFRSTRWSAVFGLSVGFTLVTRFLTGTYFAAMLVGIFVWCFRGEMRGRRAANLLLAILTAFAVSAPFFWLNRDWIYNYYVIGHFTGPESVIRAPNMGVVSSIEWLVHYFGGRHVGASFGWLALGTTTYLVLCSFFSRRNKADLKPELEPKSASRDWMTVGAIMFFAPAIVLILHGQKSELVLGILLPGFIVFLLGFWQSLNFRPARFVLRAALGWLALGIGGTIAVRGLSAQGTDPNLAVSSHKVNQLADYIYRTQRVHGLVNPRIGVDQITDSLDGLTMRVICYERHNEWVPFIMTLPTGIQEEKPEVLMAGLAASDFMFLTDEESKDGGWPYDIEMQRLHPQLQAWCDQNLRKVETFPLFGRKMTLYERRSWTKSNPQLQPQPKPPTQVLSPQSATDWRFYAVLTLLPLGAYLIARRFVSSGLWYGTAGRMILLFGLGLIAASPFLTSRGVGTGEAYNYSLALADSTTQIREGFIPPLAGQTEFAFNGRIHPLRNAPYLFGVAAVFDAGTGYALSFWQLQNLSLAFSLIAAIFSCYGALRWGASCSRVPAFALSILYGFCPALLASAYWLDLLMTVHAAPFLPLALGACLRQARDPKPSHDVLLAVALAATWLAHPPIALWLTVCIGLVRAAVFLGRPSWRELFQLVAAGLLMLALAGYVFASVSTLGLVGKETTINQTSFVELAGAAIRTAFPGNLLPIDSSTRGLSALQLGYGHWLLLAIVTGGIWEGWLRGKRDLVWLAHLALLAGAIFLLVLTLPVPHVTLFLWSKLPDVFCQLTNIWPMQRLYLVATALIILASAGPLTLWFENRRRSFFYGLGALCLLWTAFQAAPFLQRGFNNRWAESTTKKSHRPTNLDLTLTSYAFLGTPASFVHGVTDPLLEFRLLSGGQREVLSSWEEVATTAAVVTRGQLTWLATDSPPVVLKLEPHQRYLLTFSFHAPDLFGQLQFDGRTISRTYHLPEAGNARGFGTGSGHRKSLSLWTDETTAEEVSVRFVPSSAADSAQTFADFTLQLIDPARLSVVVHSLAPLYCTVNSPGAGHFLETCRRYMPGYEAKVNGQPAETLRSPDGQLMVLVPAGRSTVEIRHTGAPILHHAFILSCVTWSSLGLLLLLSMLGVPWSHHCTRFIVALLGKDSWIRRHKGYALGFALAVSIGLYANHKWNDWRDDHAIGPVRLQLLLPAGRPREAEPLVVTGRTGAGDFAYIRYLDEHRVQFGFDHWAFGKAETAPINIDYSALHLVEVRMGSLYPPIDDKRWNSIPVNTREQRKNHMELTLNGETVLRASFLAHPAAPGETTIGKNLIGGSTCGKKFTGTIISSERLPLLPP